MKIKLRRFQWTGVLFLLPTIAFILIFNAIPFVWNLVLSFQKWDGFSAPEFIGIENYVKSLGDPLVLKGLSNSVLYAVASTTGGVILGLFFATLIFRLASKEGSFFRLVLYSPAMIPTAVVGIMFVFLLSQKGLLNSFLQSIGLESLTRVWLQDSATAMACIIMVAIWKSAGSVMILTFAAMQTIPLSLYESSDLEGAGYIRQMMFITYPLIKPMILLATINTLGTQYKSYDLIYTMTRGGPGNLTTTVPIVMTKTAFAFGKFGNAASIGAIFTVVVALSILLIRFVLRGENYEY